MTEPSPADWARIVVEATDDLVYVCSEDRRIVYLNPAMRARVGRDATGAPCHEALHGLDAPCPWCPNDRVIGGGESVSWEVRSPRDGCWYHVVNVPWAQNGRRYKLAVIRDVTARREAEESRARGERLLRDVLDSAGAAVFVLDRDHRCILWNRACERLTGLPAREVLGTDGHWRGFYDTPRPTLADLVLDGATRRGPELYPLFGPSPLAPGAVRAERVLRSPEGTERYIAFEAAPVRDETGRVVAAVETIHDLTERRRVEAERERLELAVRQAAEAVVITDPEARILSANPAYEEITGVPVEEARGRLLGEVLESTDPGFDGSQARRVLLTTGRWAGRVGRRHRDGREIVLDVTATAVRDPDGRPRYGLCIFRDVTEEVRWERERLRAERLRALGTLAGGIAHDFNNLLMGILGSAELLQAEVPAEGPGARHLERIVRAGERARDLVAQILQFSRAEGEGEERADLRQVAEEVVDLLRATTPSTLEVRWLAPAGPCLVPLEPAQAHQVVLNLATNAVKALGIDPGRVELTLGPAPAGSVPPELPPGPYHRLTVRDTGCGMDPATLDRIFEPFFTTRPVGQGTGLGLSVVHGVVRAAGGAVRVESAPGRGSLFEVFLPAVQLTPERSGEPAGEPRPARPLRILVVDDEAAVREVTRGMLVSLGHRVRVAATGEEALADLRTSPADVVLTDRSMPGLTGEDLARRIRAEFPGVAVVVFTGHLEDRVAERVREAGATEVLPKPLRRGQLAAALARVAAAREGGKPEGGS